jgi:hypothetical protein
VQIVDGRELARRGEQTVIEEAQCRRPILSPISPQQRRISIDGLRLLDLFREQRVNAAGLGFAFDRDEVDLDQFRTVDARSPLLAIACFTCFIRLRSGIANSHQNKPSKITFPDRSRPQQRNYHAIMATTWWIGLHRAMAASGPQAGRRRRARGVSLSVGNGWIADVPQRFGVPEVTHKGRCTKTRISDISRCYLVVDYAIRGAKAGPSRSALRSL